MAKRLEIQMALDTVKFTNVMNDLIDCITWQLQGKDPNTGYEFLIPDADDSGNKHTPTIDELKDATQRAIAHVLGYWNVLNERFKSQEDDAALTAGLSAIGVDIAELKTDVGTMKAAIDTLNEDYMAAVDKVGLEAAADAIEAVVPKMRLVRRAWITDPLLAIKPD